jgi:hypothetical protein
MTSIKGSRDNTAQNQEPWTCVCGRTVHGNGGQSSHKRSCRPWAEHLLAENERLLARVDSGEYFTGYKRRMSDAARHAFRASIIRAIDRLRERLGLPPAPTVKAEDIKPGQTIKNGERWYTIISIADTGRPFAFDAQVTDSDGAEHPLGIWRGEHYPVQEDQS